ncbi:MAG: hypothetical protein IRZ16_00180 [Myxococcaceae bacterium]|nr:hypothetical protein [Myxococcaceae bacterium]
MSSFLALPRPVLVMSAERAVRQLLGHLLRQEGYACAAVSDGDEAFEEIARGRPLVALLDMRRGGDDDLLFLGLLRKRHPSLGAIILLPGKAMVVHGRTEHVIDHDPVQELPDLPSMEQLRNAIDWIATQTHLATFKPATGTA